MFYSVGDYDRNVNSGLEDQQFRDQIRDKMVFLIESPLKSSANDTMLSRSREGQYIYSNELTNLETFIMESYTTTECGNLVVPERMSLRLNTLVGE